jgi:hypothetical protein
MLPEMSGVPGFAPSSPWIPGWLEPDPVFDPCLRVEAVPFESPFEPFEFPAVFDEELPELEPDFVPLEPGPDDRCEPDCREPCCWVPEPEVCCTGKILDGSTVGPLPPETACGPGPLAPSAPLRGAVETSPVVSAVPVVEAGCGLLTDAARSRTTGSRWTPGY